jgi:hypothetical protein
MASMNGKLKTLDGWLRNRLRYCIWHDWKKARSTPAALIAICKSKRLWKAAVNYLPEASE